MATTRPKSSHYFLEEVIFKILSWTKGTSLLRFKSVSKLWHSIISDDKFIESHHTNSLKKPSILMIHRNVATIVNPNSPKDFVNLPLPSFFDSMDFVSSCNGIVCVHDAIKDDIYLLNPLTSMCKTLPIIYMHEQPLFLYFNPLKHKVHVAFGFDRVCNDFKVLKITYLVEGGSNYMDLLAVYMYTLNANSWREIELNFTPKIGWIHSYPILVHGPIVDGILHLHNELFASIPYPNSMQLQETHKLGLLDFEGSIAVIFESGESVDTKFSLWTMELVSGMVFWKQTLTFDARLKINQVCYFSGAKQFIGSTPSGEICSYDYKKKETKYFELPASQKLARVLNHTESFLSIK